MPDDICHRIECDLVDFMGRSCRPETCLTAILANEETCESCGGTMGHHFAFCSFHPENLFPEEYDK